MRTARIASISAENDAWLRQATAAAVAGLKELVGAQGPIRPGVPFSKLGDSELGWIASTVVREWIVTRSEQAASEGLDPERAIRVTGLYPDPWDVGAIQAILPQLAKSCAGFDWAKPANQWSKDELAGFLLSAFNLIRQTMRARDVVEERVAGKPINPDETARRLNGSIGNPLMTIDELNDDSAPPF
jgi:hypothetical protein